MNTEKLFCSFLTYISNICLFLYCYYRCDTIVRLFEDAVKVNIDEDTCKDCGSQLVTAEYKKVNEI